MQFIDTVTPQSYETYFDNMTHYLPKDLNKRDFSDRGWQHREDWSTMYYQNAYNTAMLNYMNEYNSPLQQMLRYQEAGLNPFLASQDPGNMGSSHPGAAPRGHFTAPTSTEKAAAATQAVNAVNNTLKTAQNIYDYVQYGRPLQEINVQSGQTKLDVLLQQLDNLGVQGAILNEDLRKHSAEADWSQYWNYGEGFFPEDSNNIQNSPRARYMEFSTQRIAAQIDQLQALVNVLYPSQKEANEASAALNNYKKQVLEGQTSAVLNLNTGNETADAILKQVLFFLQQKINF